MPRSFVCTLVAGTLCLASAAFAVKGGIPVCTANLNQCTASLNECSGMLNTCTTQLVTAQNCGNGVIDVGEDCDQSNLNGQTCVTQGFVGGVLKCGAGCMFDTRGCSVVRFHDNGDGTLSDNKTGLMWEEKTGSIGTPVQCTLDGCVDPHGVNNKYTWNGYDPVHDSIFLAEFATGTVFTDFLYRLNSCTSGDTSNTGGFAGHCDWRLPTIQELNELLVSPCAPASEGSPSHCIDDAFQPTQAGFYWSVTTDFGIVDLGPGTSNPMNLPVVARTVDFGLGQLVTGSFKPNWEFVRAVRGSQ